MPKKYLTQFSTEFWEDFEYWVKHDHKTSLKIIKLVQEIELDPFTGTGKPEPLKHDYAGCWSRRIDLKNRLIYNVKEDVLYFLQAKDHY